MSTFPYFLIPLFFLASLHLHPKSSVAVNIKLDGACQYHCEKNREPWHTDEPFNFTCASVYLNEKEKEKCLSDCLKCPAEVCDEYDNPNKFSCPPVAITDDQKADNPCKERCERNRPTGHRESFELDCYKDVTDDMHACYRCEGCPKFICQTDLNYASDYYCPAVQFEGVCQNRCDRNRKIGQVGPYELDCKTQNDQSNCLNECSNCPNYVCSRDQSFPGAGSKYFCPTPHTSLECQEICNKYRTTKYEYSLKCDEYFDYYTCGEMCSKCPYFICDKRDPKNIVLHCPKREEKNIWTYNPPKKFSYKGRCKTRCDNSRGGGPQEYELKCKKRYESQDEIDLCVNDCLNECPDHCYNMFGSYDDITLKCKANQTEVDRLEKERQDEIDSLKAEHERKRHRLVIALIVFGVLLAILIGGFLAYICYTRKKNRTGPVPYTYGSATTVHNQQQRMQFMPASAEILQREEENRQNANINAPQPQPQLQYPQLQSASVNSTSTPTFQHHQGNMAPSMAKSTPTLPPAPSMHPPAEPSPHHPPPHPLPLKEPPKNKIKPPSPPEPPKPLVENRQSVSVVNPTQINKPK